MAPGTTKGRTKAEVKSRNVPRPTFSRLALNWEDSDVEKNRSQSAPKKRGKKITVGESLAANPSGDAFEKRRCELEEDTDWMKDLLCDKKTGLMPDGQAYKHLKAKLEEGPVHESFRQSPIGGAVLSTFFDSKDDTTRSTPLNRSYHEPTAAHRRYLKSISESPKMLKAVPKPRKRFCKKVIVEKIWSKALQMLEPSKRNEDDDEDEEFE